MFTYRRPFLVALTLLSAASAASAQTVNPDLFNPDLFGGLRWRSIGPYRSGRVSAGSIDPRDPNIYYIGTPGGGVWKTNDGGQVWRPIFDRMQVASIGAVAVAPSNHLVVYVGTGEQTPGNGVYKSTDGGATWVNVGLRDTHVIGDIIVDPANADVALVAAIGDRTSGAERGVFKTTDGGRTWNKVLFKDDATGAPSIGFDPAVPGLIYAALSPTGGGGRGGQRSGIQAIIYRSTDVGSTWTPVAAKGLPTLPMSRQAIAIAAGTQGRRVYAMFRDGLYRSENSGDAWERATSDPRIAGIGVIADTQRANVLYVTQTALYRSTDGGKTFDAFAGAPSGDDFRLLWVDPHDSRRLLAGVDQGGIVSVNGGETWSSWYNQPTGQFYNVSTDHAFPYRVYAPQQDSGTVAVPSRSDFGEIDYRDWFSPGGFEFCFIAPDPLDPDIVYSGGWYGTVVRFDRRTNQIVHVFVRGTKYRSAGTAPLEFSVHDPHTLYLGTQFVMKTADAGMTWQAISPDLTRTSADAVGVINSIGQSAAKAGEIWVGTSTGLVQVTDDGGTTWRDVTPADHPKGTAITVVEAGAHDGDTAYVAASAVQDSHPLIFRTHDHGRTWQKIVQGLAETVPVRVVREDPVRKGLLYAGTDTSVWISFDDGDHWQPFQLNLPVSSMRDVVVHGDDLVLATYGRSLWILDNISPLRQLDARVASSAAFLYRPQPAVRVRWDMNQDTPLPIETPTSPNPPDGAMIDYYLKSAAPGDLKLTITDATGAVVRTYASTAPAPGKLPANVPEFWFSPPAALSKAAGLNRFAWNLRYPNPRVLPFGYSGTMLKYVEYTFADHAIPGQTPREQPEGPLVPPGDYTVTLTVGDQTLTQPLTVKPDPRVRATQADLVAQLDLARQIMDWLATTYDAYYQIGELRSAIATLTGPQSRQDVATGAGTVDTLAMGIQDGTPAVPGVGLINRDLARVFTMLESGDARPATSVRETAMDSCQALVKALDGWRRLNREQIPALNRTLQQRKLAPLPVAARIPAAPSCGG